MRPGVDFGNIAMHMGRGYPTMFHIPFPNSEIAWRPPIDASLTPTTPSNSLFPARKTRTHFLLTYCWVRCTSGSNASDKALMMYSETPQPAVPTGEAGKRRRQLVMEIFKCPAALPPTLPHTIQPDTPHAHAHHSHLARAFWSDGGKAKRKLISGEVEGPRWPRGQCPKWQGNFRTKGNVNDQRD